MSQFQYITCCNDDYHNICNWNNKTTTLKKKILFIPYLQRIIFETEIAKQLRLNNNFVYPIFTAYHFWNWDSKNYM